MPQFSYRSEYRSPSRSAFNACGTEGARAPGNIPRVYGMLNSEIAAGGTNIPSPGAYKSLSTGWARMSAPGPLEPKFQVATHSVGLSPLRGTHYDNNANLDTYTEF